MKRLLISLVISMVSVFALAAPATAETGASDVRIGIVADGPWARFPKAVSIFKQEIKALAEGEFTIRFPEDRTLDGGWRVEGINEALDTLLNAPDVDLVLALGYVATNEVCQRRNLKKPVFCPFVVDARIQGLPVKGGTTGVPNLNYINVQKSVEKELQTFLDIANFEHLTVIADSFEINALPKVAASMQKYIEGLNLNVDFVGYEASAQKTLENIPASTDAVLLTALLRMPPGEFEKLVRGLTDRKLPSFTTWSMEDVEAGVLATMTPAENLEHLARSVAVNVMEVLRGEDAGNLPVSFSRGLNLTINWATAKAIDVYPKWDTLTEAEILNDTASGGGRRLTLQGAVMEALDANLDLKAADRVVASGMEEVKKSRSGLLPQIFLGSDATVIDSDRAGASQGMYPEKTWTGSATARQVLYSDKAWTGYTVQKHTQEARVEDREALKLDIMNISATAYLNVLRAEAQRKIQSDNLKLTRANLERSKVRVSVGAAGPEEVYRWESELAKRMQEVLRAESALLDARSEMNRIMDRPLTEGFVASEGGVTDPVPVIKDPRILNYLDTPQKMSVLMRFLMEESLDLSPELRAIDAQVAARKRMLVSAKREFWLPTVQLQGNVTEMFDESGEGSDVPSSADDTEWSVGVSATLPLVSGGAKSAELRQTREEIARLETQRRATAERIRQRTQISMNRIRASYPGIRLSRNAADAAGNNLELVTNAYVRGVLSIIDLLDAQNLALVAEQQAANAVYDFLTDLMEVQRSVGTYFLYINDAERDEWFAKLEAYAAP